MPADDGVRWDVLKSDIRSLARRLPGVVRNDPSAVALVVANAFAVAKLTLDLIGHLVEHGKLTFEDLPEEKK